MILEDQRALLELNDFGIESERTTLPESTALILSKFSQGGQPESKERTRQERGVVVPETLFRNDDAVLISGGLQQSDETVSTGRAATLTRLRLLWRVILLLAVLTAIAFSVYFYKEQSAQLAENHDVNQLSQPLVGAATIVSPLPVKDTEMKPRQDQQVVKECPEAVEVLGLCNPDTKKE